MLIKKTDVCVIGSGIAGLITALECASFCKVLIITKNKLSESNSIYAQGGIAAPISELDSPKKHFDDTIKAGCFHNNKESVNVLTKEAKKAIQKLISYGVSFDKKNDKLDLAKEGAHSVARVLHKKDTTGLEIISKLVKELLKNKNVTILENTTVTDLFIHNKQCYGCYAINTSKKYRIQSKFTCLTTGGIGYLFGKTSNPFIASGDGLYLGYKAGCRLIDLEFIQFHPTGLNIADSNYFLISEALRGKGAKLVNSDGNFFMENYHNKAELAPRDIVARAIYKEINENRKVYLDCKTIKNFETQFPAIFDKAALYNIKLPEELLPVTPVVHYIMGGILTNTNSQTDINNLYAIGEVACNGLHGANRLASNSLLEGVVFSNKASKHIKTKLSKTNLIDIPKKEISNTKNRTDFITEIQNELWKTCGIVRCNDSLKSLTKTFHHALKNIENTNNFQKKQWLELAFLITNAAAHRQENLGSHFINNKKRKTAYWITQDIEQSIKIHTKFPAIQS